MQRRNFIKHSSLFAVGIGVFGRVEWNKDHFTGDSPTTTDILGPFYRPNAPMRTNINPAVFNGDLFHITGTIFKEDGKTPFGNSLVEVWQCSETGVYDNTSDDYNYRGSQKTGSDGKYHFISAFPVPYPTDDEKKHYRPAHVHMRISGEGQQDLVTQIYFKGDPHIEEDDSSRSPLAINRILPLAKNDKNETTVKFDIVMQKEFRPDDAVFRKISGLYTMNDNSMMEFLQSGDLLMLKWNGQLYEAFTYKGNNTFEGGENQVKVRFEIMEGGEVKVYYNYYNWSGGKEISGSGTKFLKYNS